MLLLLPAPPLPRSSVALCPKLCGSFHSPLRSQQTTSPCFHRDPFVTQRYPGSSETDLGGSLAAGACRGQSSGPGRLTGAVSGSGADPKHQRPARVKTGDF